MRYKSKIRKIVHVLIRTRFILTLAVRVRYDLIKHILKKFPSYVRGPGLHITQTLTEAIPTKYYILSYNH